MPNVIASLITRNHLLSIRKYYHHVVVIRSNSRGFSLLCNDNVCRELVPEEVTYKRYGRYRNFHLSSIFHAKRKKEILVSRSKIKYSPVDWYFLHRIRNLDFWKEDFCWTRIDFSIASGDSWKFSRFIDKFEEIRFNSMSSEYIWIIIE